MYGNPRQLLWQSPQFLCFYSLDVRKAETLKQGNDVVGSRTKVKVVKNKVAPPFKLAEFDIMYGEGISREGSIVDMGVNLEIINKSGAWFSYNGQRLGQGRENVKEYFKENPGVADEIRKRSAKIYLRHSS